MDILQGLTDLLGPRSNIGIKRMGELDEKPFVLSCKQRYGEDAEMKAAEFVSLWQEHLKDPNWHPFKIVATGSTTEVCPMKRMHIFYLPSNFLAIPSNVNISSYCRHLIQCSLLTV